MDRDKLQVFWITQKRKSFREKEERQILFFHYKSEANGRGKKISLKLRDFSRSN